MAGSKKILLIEDDYMIRELYRTAFEEAGFEIVGVNDADETFAKLQTYKPEVVFIDIMLPGKSGIDILKELRTNPKYGLQNAKLIMLTNLAQDDLAQQAEQYRADGYLIKADTVPSDLIKIVKSYDKPATQTA